MLGLFKKDPLIKLRKQMNKKLEEARDLQRKGNIVEYAKVMAEAEEIGVQIDKISGKG